MLDNDGDTEQYKMMYDELKGNISDVIKKEFQSRLDELKNSYDLHQKTVAKAQKDGRESILETIAKSKYDTGDEKLKKILDILKSD